MQKQNTVLMHKLMHAVWREQGRWYEGVNSKNHSDDNDVHKNNTRINIHEPLFESLSTEELEH